MKKLQLIIVGNIYNLMNVLQAAGRLRLSQRTASGSVDIFLPWCSDE
jgi:hypothetical protein